MSCSGAKYPEVDANQEIYGILEYELQLQLNAPKLIIGSCYNIENTDANTRFTNCTKAMLPHNIVDVYVPTQNLKQSVSEIAAKGLVVDPRVGFSFQVGSFRVNRSAEKVEVIHFKVALGNTINNQRIDCVGSTCDYLKETPTSNELRSGYHSIRCTKDGDYVVYNSAQVVAQHLITMPGGAYLEEPKPGFDICDLCGKEIATIWCVNDSAQLCAKCDEESHKSNKLVEKHKRMPLTEAKCVIEFCQVHKDQRVEYYCPKCKESVCYICKMEGSHGTGKAATHPLIPIRKAYHERIDKILNDPILKKRKYIIDQKMKVVDDKLDAIKQNADEVIAEIQRIADLAIQSVKEQAGEKALIVRSSKTELQRKRKEVETMERFSIIHKYVSLPLTFIRFFDRQEIFIDGIKETTDLPDDIRVEPDLCVFGTLDVSNRPTNKAFIQSDITLRSFTEDDFGNKSTVVSRGISNNGPVFTSLVKLANRRAVRNRDNGLILGFTPFQGSAILTDPQMCRTLYLCFPFKDQPHTHLLFSTKRDGRSIRKMHELIDEIGITSVIIKKDDYIFGGFAACKWNSSGNPFGDKTSTFLFSVTKDTLIPYRPNVSDACHLIATEDTLSFGKYDLVLADDFDRCTASIEKSYGIGFQPGSDDAEKFLAGDPLFKADIVEVWGFWRPEDQ